MNTFSCYTYILRTAQGCHEKIRGATRGKAERAYRAFSDIAICIEEHYQGKVISFFPTTDWKWS